MKPKVHFRACYMSMGIRGPTSRSKSAQAQEKTHFRQNWKKTQGSKGQMTSLTHLTFEEHPQPTQGVHRPKMGPGGLRKGSAEPPGRPTPYWAQSGPSFSCKLPPHSLRWLRMVPPRKLMRRSTLRGLYKEEESPPFNKPQEKQRAPLQGEVEVLRNGERVRGSSEGRWPVSALSQLVPRRILLS